MAESGDETLADPSAGAPPAPGRRWVGRYLLLDVVGAGGMGTVYKAYDPSLERHVAVKVLAGASARPERLEREGQVIAQLSHPNVVSVFDLGTDGDQLYIAMEYVAGKTLAAWLAGDRAVPEILDVMVQAARGLAAGHAKGIVHRDVKPTNILVGDEGVVRVVDFGIARVASAEVTDDAAASPDEKTTVPALTAAGTLLGTPRYMAPEQYLGGTVGAAADQYAFCVVLYEALTGRSPFTELHSDELRSLGRPREVAPWPTDASVPAWLVRIVDRGLSAVPSKRFPSMNALVDELTADRGLGRRRVLGAAAGASVAGVAIAAFLVHERQESPCAAVARAAEAVRLEEAAKTSPAFADAVETKLRTWRAARIDACQAGRVRNEQSETLLDRRMVCLDRRLGELRALVRTVATATPAPDPADAVDAVDAVDSLPGLAACADADALMQAPPRPDDPAARARVDALFARLDEGYSLKYLDRLDEARTLGEKILPDARATTFRPLVADTLALLSGVYRSLGRNDDSIKSLWEMYAVSAAAHDDRAMADALVSLVYTLGDPDDKRFPEAVALVPAAEGLALRSGDEEILAKMWLNTGLVIDLDGNNEDDAARRYHEALVLGEKLYGSESLEVARVYTNLGSLETDRGNYDAAITQLDHALRIKKKELGEAHRDVVAGIYNIGVVLELAERQADALVRYDEGIAIAKHLSTPDPDFIARLELARSDALLTLERYDEALAAAQAATSEDPALAAMAVFSVGHIHHVRGDLAPAIEAYRRALAMTETSLGADSLHVYNPVYQLAKALCASGQTREGIAFAERAVAVGKRYGRDAETNAQAALDRCRGVSPARPDP